jgi:hypothetical protein
MKVLRDSMGGVKGPSYHATANLAMTRGYRLGCQSDFRGSDGARFL